YSSRRSFTAPVTTWSVVVYATCGSSVFGGESNARYMTFLSESAPGYGSLPHAATTTLAARINTASHLTRRLNDMRTRGAPARRRFGPPPARATRIVVANPPAAADDGATVCYPVSVKGVVLHERGVVLVKNRRNEWELPGGKLEPGETLEACVAREIAEELGLTVRVGPVVDVWIYAVSPDLD